MQKKTREFSLGRFYNRDTVQDIVVWAQGMIDGPTHNGGVLRPGAIEPGIARIAARGNSELEHLAASWRNQQFSIPAAIEQSRIELETAKTDLGACKKVLKAHRAEYMRRHHGLEPAAPGTRSTSVGFWILAGLFAFFEMPLTAAAFERLLATDAERAVATVGAAAIIIGLSHTIGFWFAKPAPSLGQRLVGWLLVFTLGVILATLSAVRVDAIKRNVTEPPKSTPEVRLEVPEKGRSFHV
jgi:hypothetical protein